MIRLILIVIYLLLYLILGLPVLLAEWIIGHFNQSTKDKSSLAIVSWGFRCILFLAGVKISVKGEENIPNDRAVLYVANHRSYFDIVICYALAKHLTGFVAKLEMKKIPIFRLWMKNVHCLFLDRDDIRQGLQTILTGVEQIKSGISMFIFPEGTRNKVEGTFLPFKGGSFKIAEKAGAPVIPIAISHAAAIFEDHIPWVKATHIIVEYGKPIETAGMTPAEKKELPKKATAAIMEMYEHNKEF